MNSENIRLTLAMLFMNGRTARRTLSGAYFRYRVAKIWGKNSRIKLVLSHQTASCHSVLLQELEYDWGVLFSARILPAQASEFEPERAHVCTRKHVYACLLRDLYVLCMVCVAGMYTLIGGSNIFFSSIDSFFSSIF